MILAGRLANPEDVARFQTEAAAAAKLRHPNIVAVHDDVGETDGHNYFTMEYIEEAPASIKALHAQGPLPNCKSVTARYAMRILATRAVGYAHKQGILHRDLKPLSNILIDAADEPHDHRLRAGETARSQQLRPYAARGPCWARAELHVAGAGAGQDERTGVPAADVRYSLGAILYELIYGPAAVPRNPPRRRSTR